MKLTITGYEQDTFCGHCGRKLTHGIKLSDGRVVGATCFAQELTIARVYNGRKYRLDADTIIQLAKIAEFWSADRQRRAGYSHYSFDFEAAEMAVSE